MQDIKLGYMLDVPTHDNRSIESFISGEWYDHEYEKGWYGQNYNREHPKWAAEFDRYYIDLIAMHIGFNINIKILDVGCGVGNFVRGWENRGYKNIYGIDISEKAIGIANHPNIKRASVTNLPFKNKEFDLVFSSSFMEHIATDIEHKALKEISRVGKMQAHLIGLEEGDDPSHINIKTIEEWVNIFSWYYDDNHIVIDIEDFLLGNYPVLLVIPKDRINEPLKIKMHNANKKGIA